MSEQLQYPMELGDPSLAIVDRTQPINRPYSVFYEGIMPDAVTGESIPIVVKTAESGWEPSHNMVKNDIAFYIDANASRPYLPRHKADTARNELTMVDLTKFGYEQHLGILKRLSLPQQRALFVSLMAPLGGVFYDALIKFREPNDFAGPKGKGVWIRQSSGDVFDVKFTDFGVFGDQSGDAEGRYDMPTNFRRLWLADPEEGYGIATAFPFVRAEDDRVVVDDEILSKYKHPKTGESLSSFLTDMLQGRYEKREDRSTMPSVNSALEVWHFFMELQRNLPHELLISQEAPALSFSSHALLKQLVSKNILTSPQWGQLANYFGLTVDELKNLIEVK